MNRMLLLSTLLLGVGVARIHAGEGRPPVDVFVSLTAEHDDNVFTTGSGIDVPKQESFKFIGQADILVDTEQNASYFGIRYSPSVIWFDDRPGDSTDVAHELDFSFRQKLTPRSNLYVKDTFRSAQEPELVREDVVFRNNNDYVYNSLNVSYDNQIVPEKTTIRLDGRYAVMRYDDSRVADVSDYDQFSVGMDLTQRLNPGTEAGGQIRYTDLSYDDNVRDSQSVQVGAVLSRMLNPRLQTDVRAGYENRRADDAVEESSHSPYVDFSAVYLAARDTRVSAGAGYGYEKSPTSLFAQQKRTSLYGSVSQRLSPAVLLNLNVAYFMGTFDTDDATSLFNPGIHNDGDETTLQLGIRLSYQINVRNWVEASYQYTELTSDVRPADEFDRNRVSIGWKYSL